MRYQTIVKGDLVNGEGVRCSLFVSGCSHGCDGCFNEEAWDYRSGEDFGEEQVLDILDELSKPYITGLSLLGGDPLMPKNISTVIDLCKRVKEKYPDKDIWCWTGYTLDEVYNNHAKEILQYCDVIIDGKFMNEQKDLTLSFRGSSNQRILRKGIQY